ncbi:MAG: ExbD/TolR family protein [Hyphomonadaceae bacterium]
MTLKPRRREAHQPAAEPNVIPFIDVLLVLLIIFMVTAPKPTTDLRLDMMRASGVAPTIIEPIAVSLQRAADGGVRVLVNDQETTLEGLARSALVRVLAQNAALTAADAHADARVYVRSDEDVAYAYVVAAVDELQTAGFAKVGVLAERIES